MFFRTKKSGSRTYLQIVENRWEHRTVKQRVLATLGRLDELQHSGQLAALLSSGARFADAVVLHAAQREGTLPTITTQRTGAPLVFERLWTETGSRAVIEKLLSERKYEFSVERAVFLTVLHRLFDPGSDRAAERWREDYRIDGVQGLELHQVYRAMAWLGEELAEQEQRGRTPFVARCMKDRVEEELFAYRRDLFSSLDLVFFDTTSIYFEGAGGKDLGRRGKTKDHRPDLPQMVVGVVVDAGGRPVCCELWPGNTSDVKSLIPVVERLRQRFSIGRVCVVADRGMISREVIRELEAEERGWLYILGARLRAYKEVRTQVLADPGPFEVVHPKSRIRKDPSPLQVKEVRIGGRRYVVCFNEDQAKKDAADREAIAVSLRSQLKQGAKTLVGNKGYRKYLKVRAAAGFVIDEEKLSVESRYDGIWVLRTNTELCAAEVALKYKQLWMVEQVFRSMKSLLETRPIYHKRDETIRGHVFCSFLALVLRKELQDRLSARGDVVEWADVIRDLDRVQDVEVGHNGKRFWLRTEASGCSAKVFQAAGVALPPTVRSTPPAAPGPPSSPPPRSAKHGATPPVRPRK